MIYANIDVSAVGVFFFGAYLANNFGVSDFLVSFWWDLLIVDKKECVDARGVFTRAKVISDDALVDLTEFIGI